MIGLVFQIVWLAVIVWVAFDVFSVQKGMELKMKFVWIAFAIVLHVVGAAVYYFIGRSRS